MVYRQFRFGQPVKYKEVTSSRYTLIPLTANRKITIVKETELDTDLIHDAAFESFHQLLKKKSRFS
uniref:hypothetical protein n=1 Tax=Ileibacterium valens TaxID=1862668 RepID=UPI00272D61F6